MTIRDLKSDVTSNTELDVAIRNMKKGGYTIELEDLEVWCYYTNIELDVAIATSSSIMV